MTTVRDARDDQAAAVDDLLSRAGFGPSVGRLIAYPRTSPHGDVLVAEDDGRLLGGVCCASFGPTGWIGALGVAPEARRQGLGTALTQAACARLRERGAQTVLLFATDLGRPVYERLGFEAEGNATAWRGSAGTARAGVSLRRLREADRPAVLRLDREATGERREAVLDAISPLGGLLVERAGEPVGWAAASPWGAGVAICARDPEAGVTLLAAAAGSPQAATVVVPDANAAAVDALQGWRFSPSTGGERMRLGPPVPWRPEMQFGLFNLFWG